MPGISDWSDLVRAIGPYLMTESPLRSLQAAGFELEGELAEVLGARQLPPASHRDVMARLRNTYGELPATLQIGAAPQEPSPVALAGYAMVATTELAVLNAVLAELYRVETFPHALTPERSAQIVDIATLRTLCTGVPDDASELICRFNTPVVASASSTTQLNLHLRIDCALEILSPATPALVGVVEAEVPLQFEVTGGKIRPAIGAVSEITARFDLSPGSVVQPRSNADREELSAAFQLAAGRVLLYLRQEILAFSASVPVHKKRFPNSTIDVTQVGAVVIRQSGRDYAVIGCNVERTREVNPIGLIGQLTPVAPYNLRAVVDEEFATDALSSVITSGDLAAFFNRVIERNSPVRLKPITVERGSIRLLAGRVRVSLNCVVVDACAFNKDLHFTATVNGAPGIQNGNLTITASNVDFNVDNTDAVVCSLLGAYLGPFGVAVYAGAIAFLAAINPSSSDLNIPIAETSDPLPGSDKVLDVELLRAKMDPGVLMAEGTLQLISDPLRIYAYLRVLNTFLPPMPAPLVGATVELYELDKPAPEGDDVVDPSSYTETLTPILETTVQVVYTPRTDELLGTGTTDERGRVTFVAIGNTIGGSARRTRVQENLRTGHVSVTTRHELVGEGLPDLAVTIRSADGTLLAQRRLIGLNVNNRRLGRFDQPLDVRVRVVPQFHSDPL